MKDDLISAVNASLAAGAPGLSQNTRNAIVRNVALRMRPHLSSEPIAAPVRDDGHSKDFQLMLVRIIQRHRNGRDLTDTLKGAEDLLKRKGSLSVFRSEAPAPAGDVPGEAQTERVRHVKRGTEYEVLGEAEAQVSTGYTDGWGTSATIRDGNSLTVYRDPNNGKLWCRFTDEFRDGRFETLTPAQAPDKAGEREGVEQIRDDVLFAFHRYAKVLDPYEIEAWAKLFPQFADDIRAHAVEMIDMRFRAAALAPQPNGTGASRGVIPAGWKLVPVEPTDGMIQAFDRAWWAKTQDVSSPTPTEHPEDGGGPVGYGWRAALAATPPTPASTAQCDEMSKAACDVLAERRRQVEVEGWTSEHDDAHDGGEMAIAAACYATAPPATYTEREWMFADRPKAWPWHSTWWKPTFYRCNLVKAGALIVAEIERLDRRGVAATPTPPLSPDSTGPAGRPIDEAPRDGTPIIAWGAPSLSEPDAYEWRQTRWTLYGEGSIAHARHKAGQGPEGYWDWCEPIHNWGSSWEPTRFIDLPALTPSAPIAAPVRDAKSASVFPLGERVRKIKGSSWQGRVCGFYSTDLTPKGVCVESEREPGSVQIYPAQALASIPAPAGDVPGEAQTQEGMSDAEFDSFNNGSSPVPKPWKHCPSTHCERAEECRSPHDCIVRKGPRS